MRCRRVRVLLQAAVVAALLGRCAFAEVGEKKQGTAEFLPAVSEAELPKQFQLQRHTFPYEQKLSSTGFRGMHVYALTFPSPMVTPDENNNTVHCEYFRPLQDGKHPGVIVLHILGGDFDLARVFCRMLASNGVSALFLKMPYYGERRQPNSDRRMISLDPGETVLGMTQAVLDIRQAAAWLSSQEEVNSSQLGIMGISLGGITSALAAGIEPRFMRVCLILAGGDMGEVAWTSTEMEPLRKKWAAQGGSKEDLFAALKSVDPVTYARPVAGRKILMLNASHDEVVPPACTRSLWRAFGEPEIIWWDAGHYSAVRYIFSGMAKTVQFFQPAAAPVAAQSTAK